MKPHPLERLEGRLKSLKPRRVSADTHQQILEAFGRKNREGDTRERFWDSPIGLWFRFRFLLSNDGLMGRALIPALLCVFVFGVAVSKPGGATRSVHGREGAMFALAAMTNQSFASYLPRAGFIEHNGLPSSRDLGRWE